MCASYLSYDAMNDYCKRAQNSLSSHHRFDILVGFFNKDPVLTNVSLSILIKQHRAKFQILRKKRIFIKFEVFFLKLEAKKIFNFINYY